MPSTDARTSTGSASSSSIWRRDAGRSRARTRATCCAGTWSVRVRPRGRTWRSSRRGSGASSCD
jgi:hypothetical protein